MRKPETFACIRQRFMAILDAEYWFSLREFSLFLQATEQRSHLGEDRYRVACIGFVAVEGDAVIFEINVFAAEARTLRCSNACLTHKLNQVRRGVVIELHKRIMPEAVD